MAVLMTPPEMQFFDDNGDPLAGGKVYTYSAGTTAPLASYTDNTEGTENANPVILDAAGRAPIWLNGSYKIVVTDSADVTISTSDNVSSFSTLAEAVSPYFESFSGDNSETDFTTSEDLGTDSEALMVFENQDEQDYVTNGDFATDTDWTKGSGWTISGGVADASGAISTALTQDANFPLVEGIEYTLTYTVTRSAGGIIPSLGGGNNGTERTASGTYTEVLLAGSSQEIAFTGNSFTGTLDDISIKVANKKGFEIVNPSSYTINGTAFSKTPAPASGTGNLYIFAPSLLLGAASSAAAAAAASASQAAASANSVVLGDGTSTTSLAIGTGSKVFTIVESDLSWEAGQFLLAVSDADPTNYMHGQVTSYSGNTLDLNVTNVGGSGTFADWSITISGTQGAQGNPGSVTSITAGDGLSGGTITTSGTIAVDVNSLTDATVTASDEFAFADVDDSNNMKKDTIQGILDLAGGGALEYITTVTASSGSTVDIDNIFDGSYTNYKAIVTGLRADAVNRAAYILGINTGGSVVTTTSHAGRRELEITGSTLTETDFATETATLEPPLVNNIGTTVANPGHMILEFFAPNSSTFDSYMMYSGVIKEVADDTRWFWGCHVYEATTAFRGFRIGLSAGSFENIKIDVYGYRES